MSGPSELLRFCEETFLDGNLETALTFAVSVARSNPDAPETLAHVAAYRIHLAAATRRTIARETDWYTVLGIDPCLSNTTDHIFNRYFELEKLLNAETRPFAAMPGAYTVIKRAIVILGCEDSRKAYDARSGHIQEERIPMVQMNLPQFYQQRQHCRIKRRIIFCLVISVITGVDLLSTWKILLLLDGINRFISETIKGRVEDQTKQSCRHTSSAKKSSLAVCEA